MDVQDFKTDTFQVKNLAQPAALQGWFGSERGLEQFGDPRVLAGVRMYFSVCAHTVKSGQHPAVSLIKLQAYMHTDSQISILFNLRIVAHVLLNCQLRLVI